MADDLDLNKTPFCTSWIAATGAPGCFGWAHSGSRYFATMKEAVSALDAKFPSGVLSGTVTLAYGVVPGTGVVDGWGKKNLWSWSKTEKSGWRKLAERRRKQPTVLTVAGREMQAKETSS